MLPTSIQSFCTAGGAAVAGARLLAVSLIVAGADPVGFVAFFCTGAGAETLVTVSFSAAAFVFFFAFLLFAVAVEATLDGVADSVSSSASALKNYENQYISK